MKAEIEPENATDRQLFYRVTDEHGVDSNLAELHVQERTAYLHAKGDGSLYTSCKGEVSNGNERGIATAFISGFQGEKRKSNSLWNSQCAGIIQKKSFP